jgi:hypothetical protein
MDLARWCNLVCLGCSRVVYFVTFLSLLYGIHIILFPTIVE